MLPKTFESEFRERNEFSFEGETKLSLSKQDQAGYDSFNQAVTVEIIENLSSCVSGTAIYIPIACRLISLSRSLRVATHFLGNRKNVRTRSVKGGVGEDGGRLETYIYVTNHRGPHACPV